MKLFLWGAPCQETIAKQQMLAMRGYEVRSLYDVSQEEGPAGPRQRKQFRALEMMQADAVVLVYEDDREEAKRCAQFCQELGVPMVVSQELPFHCPIELDNTELISSIDVSYTIVRTPITRHSIA